MSQYLTQVKSLSSFSSGNFFTLYGRPSSGKTHLAGTFPDPLFISYKDKGLATVSDRQGDYIEFDGTFEDHCDLLEELKSDRTHKTFIFDTFGVYIDSLQKSMLRLMKKKAMTQQMWGDLGTQVKMLLDLMKDLSNDHYVIVTFHESPEVIEGYEQELTPNVGCFVSPTIKKALYGVTNFAIHTFIYNYLDPNTQRSTPVFAAHIGTNPFYWTKFQKPSAVQIPEMIFNPTYEELYKLMTTKGE